MEDAKITEMLSSRDQAGLAELKRKYYRLIMKVCRGILRSPEDAEEVANDTLLAVWDRIPPDEPDDLTAYVCRIARCKAINRYHYNTAAIRNADLLTELDECIPSRSRVEDEFERAELTAALNDWLGTLDGKKRGLFIARYFYMLSVKESARQCSMSVTAATTALMRLREGLKKFLTERKMFL